jgi:hypothetical protein
MKRVILSFVLLGLLTGGARADIMLSTSNAPGTPLTMTPGATSGPMVVNVSSNGFPNNMADWQFRLIITPEAGAIGSLTFKDPASGITSPSNPTNYVFGNHGTGIVATNGNGGLQLDANDFDNNFGTSVPGSPGANLLQLTFLSSSNASGLFSISAVQGNAFTLWDDGSNLNNPQFFTNVPNGTGSVPIGEVRVQGTATAAPEPSALTLLGFGVVTLIGSRRLWKKQAAA